MSKVSEGSIRSWLKRACDALGVGLEWQEPGRGGSIGLADARLKFENKELPVELKMWDRTRRGVRCKMRPAQIRYHVMEARAGRQTAILVGVRDKRGGFEVWLIPGRRCPREEYGDHAGWVRIDGAKALMDMLRSSLMK